MTRNTIVDETIGKGRKRQEIGRRKRYIVDQALRSLRWNILKRRIGSERRTTGQLQRPRVIDPQSDAGGQLSLGNRCQSGIIEKKETCMWVRDMHAAVHVFK